MSAAHLFKPREGSQTPTHACDPYISSDRWCHWLSEESLNPTEANARNLNHFL